MLILPLALPMLVAVETVPLLTLKEPEVPNTLEVTVAVDAGVGVGVGVGAGVGSDVGVVVVAGAAYLIAKTVKCETGADTSLAVVFSVDERRSQAEPVQ